MFNDQHIVTGAPPYPPSPPRSSRSRVSRRVRAFHEAGHAVMAMYWGSTLGRKTAVTVRPRYVKGDTFRIFSILGCCNIVWNEWLTTETPQIVTFLAGPLAQQRGVGGDYEYADDDEVWEACASAAFVYPHEYPVMDDLSQCVFLILRDLGEFEPDDLLDFIRHYEAVTRKLLAHPMIWDSITRLADALMQQYSLSDQQVFDLIGAEVMHGAYRRQ